MIPGSANPLLLASASAAAAPVQIERSLRFNSSDSAFCSRTPASTSTTTTWTWSAWVKRSTLGAKGLFGAFYGNASRYFLLRFSSSDQIDIFGGDYSTSSTTTNVSLVTTSVYRDLSAWMHIVFAYDTTNGTASDRACLYVNGVRVTAFSTATYPGPSSATFVNYNTATHYIGAWWTGSEFFDGYLADIHFIDGQALTPSSFTEVSATTGRIEAKLYAGSFGTNGFWLPFNNNSTAAALGTDYSGNSNTWTVNNLSVTAGAGNDSLVDTPTSNGTPDTGVGGEVRGNYCTWNAVNKSANTTLSNGNLNATSAVADWRAVLGTIGMSSGKWYWEITITGASYHLHGIAKQGVNLDAFIGTDANGWGYYASSGTYHNSSYINTGVFASYTTNDVIGVAFDADNGSLYFYKNGTVQNSGDAAYTALTSGPYFPAVSHFNSTNSDVNFGQRAFAYQTPGTNRPAATFLALCDTNLGAPLVAKPNTLFDVVKYDGNGGTQTISSLAFSPDFVWIKRRSSAFDSLLYDTVRGNGPNTGLISNATNAEGGATDNATYGYLNAFNSTGFALTAGSSSGYVNTSGQTYVGWAWDAGTSTDPSNTAGSITSQVRANVSAGFSIVTFTSNASGNATVGHGLGVAPSLVILKNRTGGTGNWLVFHKAVCTKDNFLYLNSTNALGTYTDAQGAAIPSSTVFGINAGIGIPGSADCVAYAFSPVVGYSSALAWTGNGSADGPLLHCGFSPRFWIWKRTDTTGDWWMIDTARSNTGNPVDEWLAANRSDAEYPNDGDFDFLSNGIKIRTTSTSVNASGGSYIGFAWASNPFQYARAQ